MKRVLALSLAFLFCIGIMTACTPTQSNSGNEGGNSVGVTLNTFSTFAGNDGNAQNYQEAIAAWQTETGNKISDSSATSDESVKAKIRTDFTTGSEPDVLFYFTGADADPFLEKVVSIEEIRKEYPDYAGNMNEDLVPKATNGNWYAVPMNGYWENLFVNKDVLEAAGVDIPVKDYTWDGFLADCEKIKEAGYTPIAASFVDVPHYWWEYTIFNNNVPADHLALPVSTGDPAGTAWVHGMQDIKDLYELGYFPENVLSEKDEGIQELFYTDKAAFMLDGHWRANTIKTRCSDADGNIDAERLANYTVANFPAKDGAERKSTDLITGISSGWYITKKAWDDVAKRDACVRFVEYMTSDEKVSLFTGIGASALKNGVTLDENELDSLDKDIISMLSGMTGSVPAVQDIAAGDARNTMFQAIPQMVSGKITPEHLVQDFIDAF